MMFNKFVTNKIRTTTAAFARALLSPKESSFGLDLDKLTKPSHTFCRGITRDELDRMLLTNKIQTFRSSFDEDIGKCEYLKQTLKGQGGLLSVSSSFSTANMYGANRSFVPRDGAIITIGTPAFYVPISEHVRLCPQIGITDIERTVNVQRGSYLTEVSTAVSMPDYIGLTIGVNETAIVVGHHNGVDFSNTLLDVNINVYSISHVVGSGRGLLVDCQTCVIETYVNPDFSQRALSVELTLTNNPEHLEILVSQMVYAGTIDKEQRLLTPNDAALIQSDEELSCYLTGIAGRNGPVILRSVPKEIQGTALVPYLRDLLSSKIDLDIKNSPKNGPRRTL